MRSTGIVRKADVLNRIVIPRELCKTLEIKEGTPIEIFTENDTIILRKYEPGCIFCGSLTDITEFKGKHVCTKCRKG